MKSKLINLGLAMGERERRIVNESVREAAKE